MKKKNLQFHSQYHHFPIRTLNAKPRTMIELPIFIIPVRQGSKRVSHNPFPNPQQRQTCIQTNPLPQNSKPKLISQPPRISYLHCSEKNRVPHFEKATLPPLAPPIAASAGEIPTVRPSPRPLRPAKSDNSQSNRDLFEKWQCFKSLAMEVEQI